MLEEEERNQDRKVLPHLTEMLPSVGCTSAKAIESRTIYQRCRNTK
jgi:hypothetical protein